MHGDRNDLIVIILGVEVILHPMQIYDSASYRCNVQGDRRQLAQLNYLGNLDQNGYSQVITTKSYLL